MDNNKVTTRVVKTLSGIKFILKYYHDADLIDGYNQKEFLEKNCLLCQNIGKISSDDLNHSDYILTKKQHSLFDGHRLLTSKTHGGEFIIGRMRFLLDFLSKNKKLTLAYGGSKNSSINHYHFTCHTIDENIKLPLRESAFNPDYYKKISIKDNIEIGEIEHYGRGAIVLKGKSEEKITEKFYELTKHIRSNYTKTKQPFINLYMWMENNDYCLVLVPRSVYKPSEYYDENNDWDIALGVLEVGGIFLLKNHNEFMHTNADFLKKLCDEVSFNDEHIKEIIQYIE